MIEHKSAVESFLSVDNLWRCARAVYLGADSDVGDGHIVVRTLPFRDIQQPLAAAALVKHVDKLKHTGNTIY